MRSLDPDNSEPAFSSPAGPGRRGVLGAALGLALIGGLSACTDTVPPAPEPLSADEVAVNRTVVTARRLRADALALAAAHPSLGTVLHRVAAVHEAHLTALGAAAGPASTPSPSSPSPSSPSPSASATAVPLTPTQLAKAERTAARTALRDGEAADPAFAVLLCRIAAGRATNTDVVTTALGHALPGPLTPAAAATGSGPTAPPTGGAGPTPTGSTTSTDSAASGTSTGASTGTPTGSPSAQDPQSPALTSINRLLAGQYAAVYVYPLIVARVDDTRRAQARTLWQNHRNDRDRLTEYVLALGGRPATPGAAYEISTPPVTVARAVALAARVEGSLAALAADVVAAATGADRALGADALVEAARRTAGWTGRPVALPGLSPNPTGTASPGTTVTPGPTAST